MSKHQQELLNEVEVRFNTADDAGDLAILYEITGYQADIINLKPRFWETYGEIEPLEEEQDEDQLDKGK